MKGDGASITAVNNRLAVTHTLPLVLDDVTRSEPARVFQLIDTIMGNKTLDRAHTNGTNRRSATWLAPVFMSNNESLRSKLSSLAQNTAGIHRRLVEFDFANPLLAEQADARATALLAANSGHVMRAFMREFTAHRAEFEAVFHEKYDLLTKLPAR